MIRMSSPQFCRSTALNANDLISRDAFTRTIDGGDDALLLVRQFCEEMSSAWEGDCWDAVFLGDPHVAKLHFHERPVFDLSDDVYVVGWASCTSGSDRT